MARAQSTGKGRKESSADKRAFLATMSTEVIRSIQRAALEDDVSASEILEEAAKKWLKKRKTKRKD